jgi:hypothetical protein
VLAGGAVWLAILVLPAALPAQDLGEVTRRIPAQRLRASSGLFDPESNDDARPIPPHATITVADLEGPGEIRHMWFTLGALDRRYTRSVVLRVYWDGAEVPSVESPIGDFFAAGNGMRANVSSLPIEVTSYGRAFNSYWRMPFARRARITMTNDSDRPVDACYYYIDWLKFSGALPPDTLYFHARYRQDFPPTPFTSYEVAQIRGDGHYVGTVLSIQSSMGHWLGESDDRFYIDDEETPSIVGTGMEDYFTDAWNLRQFTNLRAGVSIYEPKGLDQRATMYRWHVADPVVFTKSLRVVMERRSFAGVVNPSTGKEEVFDFVHRPDSFSSVAFWYATTPAPRFWEFPPLTERVNPEIFVETTLQADKLQAGGGAAVSQRVTRSSNAASGPVRRLMTYVDNRAPGGWLEVPVQIGESGNYSVSVYQVLFAGYGVWKVTMKGPHFEQVLDPAMDFYDFEVALTANTPENYLYGTWHENKVGVYRLETGLYTVRFECIGANPIARVPSTTYSYIGTRRLELERAFQPGFAMALDGLSFRKLPWGDSWEWIQEYVKQDAQLSARRMADARRMVRELAAAIERFNADVEEYPRSLEELQQRPARLADRRGRWPYLTDKRIPLDPWGQPYRYQSPGKHNTTSFDIYSVHGNERQPSGWIGNWVVPVGDGSASPYAFPATPPRNTERSRR